jgi:uncharacterized protein
MRNCLAMTTAGLLQSIGRQGLFLLGGASFAVGAVGLVLPVLPTTVFWIIAAWAWSKSCPRLQNKLYAMPVAGAHVRAWIEDGTISRRGKQFALGGLSFGLASCAWALSASPVILTLAGLPQILAGIYIATRPEA